MGYNRSGTRRKQRLKRHKRELERLVAKYAEEEGAAKPAEAAKPAPAKGGGKAE